MYNIYVVEIIDRATKATTRFHFYTKKEAMKRIKDVAIIADASIVEMYENIDFDTFRKIENINA